MLIDVIGKMHTKLFSQFIYPVIAKKFPVPNTYMRLYEKEYFTDL